jgi:hypothetical protein
MCKNGDSFSIEFKTKIKGVVYKIPEFDEKHVQDFHKLSNIK